MIQNGKEFSVKFVISSRGLVGKKKNLINAGLIQPALLVVISAVNNLRPYQALLPVLNLGDLAMAT